MSDRIEKMIKDMVEDFHRKSECINDDSRTAYKEGYVRSMQKIGSVMVKSEEEAYRELGNALMNFDSYIHKYK